MSSQNPIEGEYFSLPQEHVVFGAGSVSKLAGEVERIQGRRVLIVTGQSLATQTDVVARVTQALGSLHVGTFAGIRQHTPKSDVSQGVEQARKLDADTLVSVGGGSPIDATKAIAMTLSQERGSFPAQIAIPTTLSAAEFSHLVGVTDEERSAKVGFAHTQVTPRSVILDASLTLDTPMQLWLSSGIRSLDHAVETLYAPGIHPINDALALEAIRKLFEFLPRSKAHPGNLNDRTELQLASWMSFFSELNTAMGLSHNLGRRIGASYGVPHGITSCITLAHVMRAFASYYPTPLLRIAQNIEVTTSAADAVGYLVKQLGLPRRLRDVGINKAELHTIAATTPCREMKAEEIEVLLEKMW